MGSIRGLIDGATGQEITDMTEVKSGIGLSNVDDKKLALTADAATPAAAEGKVVLYFDSVDGVLKARTANGDIYGIIAHKLN